MVAYYSPKKSVSLHQSLHTVPDSAFPTNSTTLMDGSL
ncbi:hypothetical protein F0726_02338 [Acidithiobacillus caldus]|nr:hypothetical protein F0726_02338 [Acidithiobacillus caldus]